MLLSPHGYVTVVIPNYRGRDNASVLKFFYVCEAVHDTHGMLWTVQDELPFQGRNILEIDRKNLDKKRIHVSYNVQM